VRKIFKEAGGASNDSSRAKVTKGEADGDYASEGDALSPRFASAFAAVARVNNLEPCRKGARKAPRTGRDGELSRQQYRGSAILPLSTGSISTTAVATSRLLQRGGVFAKECCMLSAATRCKTR
jgi:hypothetical protein